MFHIIVKNTVCVNLKFKLTCTIIFKYNICKKGNLIKKLLIFLCCFVSLQTVHAQTLEPKLYANIPTGLNVFLLGFGHTQGAIPENPILGLEDPNLNIESAFLVYARTFSFFGKHSKFDLIMPYSTLDGTANQFANPVSREVQGMGDTKARISFNLFGAPALSVQEFATYRPDVVVGMSLQATIPTGQHDSSKLINIGTHRWALKPGIGIAKTIDKYTFEFSADAEFYSANDEFYGGISRKQEPIYSAQVHALYAFSRGMWLGVGATYYNGGEFYNNGIGANNALSNTRLGATFSLPLSQHHALKLYGNSGIDTRYGTDFDSVGIAWQYTWLDGH